MKKVITYGTFDILHIGHINLLKRARSLGDKLIVGLSSDNFNAQKHKSALLNYHNRKVVLEAIRYVDMVIPEISWEQKILDIQKYNIDIFVIGDDWEGKFDFLKEYCKVIYLSRTDGISTSQIKNEL
jgi:glycerol-3-phosphate cytidylyltransferase